MPLPSTTCYIEENKSVAVDLTTGHRLNQRCKCNPSRWIDINALTFSEEPGCIQCLEIVSNKHISLALAENIKDSSPDRVWGLLVREDMSRNLLYLLLALVPIKVYQPSLLRFPREIDRGERKILTQHEPGVFLTKPSVI